MNLRSALLTTSLVALSAPLFAAGPATSADPTGLTSTFSVTQKTKIPGEVLKPGQYIIHVVDHLYDRVLLRIDSPSGDQHAIFLGVPSNLTSTTGPGIVSWQEGPNHTPAFRGFAFSSGPAVEFVYPKAEAAQLAKLNSAKVVAIDPEAERLPKLRNLTEDEMREINLWSLALTTTGVDKKTPAILAQKFQPPVPAPSNQPVVARNTVPQAQAETQPQAQVAQLEQPALVPPSRATQPRAPRVSHRTPVIDTLPHTGSYLPLIAMIGFLSMLIASLIRLASFTGRPENA